MSADELRSRLKTSSDNLEKKYLDRIAIIEWWRPLAAIGAVIGAAVAGVSRLVTDPAKAELSVGMAVGGAVWAAACGVAIALMDYRKLEISGEAKAALKVTEDALAELKEREDDLVTTTAAAATAASMAKGFDKKRYARIDAIRLMIECVEAGLLKKEEPARTAVKLLDFAADRIQAAVDYQVSDFFTLTIFKREQRNQKDGERMYPIARNWTDKSAAATGGRSWPKGKGYTGVLWGLASINPKASLVEPDTTVDAARHTYPVENADPAREARYRSVAAFPITVGPKDDIWGIVTATSSRAGVFDHSGDLARQSVEAVRDVALIAGLLAKLDDRS